MALGAGIVLVVPDHSLYGQKREESLARFIESVDIVSAYAEPYALKLGIEVLYYDETDFVNSADDALTIIEQVGRGNLGVVLDTAEIMKDETGVTFVLLGDGKEKPALVSSARERSLDNVLFLPPLPKIGMAQALAAANACLAILKPIELYKTTYPNKVFDYMAAGRPVLLAIDGVIRELVEAAQGGIFVRPGDPADLAKAVRTLRADPGLCQQMGKAGRLYIENHYSRSQIAEQFNQMIGSIRRKNA